MPVSFNEFIEKQFKALHKAKIMPLIESELVPDEMKKDMVFTYQAADFKSNDIPDLKRRFKDLHKLTVQGAAYVRAGEGGTL